MAGVRPRRRAPALFQPGEVFFRSGMLLIFTFGISLGAIEDTYLAADWPWFWIFCSGAAGCTILYFWVVAAWLRWMTVLPADDSQPSAAIDSNREQDHHSGEL